MKYSVPYGRSLAIIYFSSKRKINKTRLDIALAPPSLFKAMIMRYVKLHCSKGNYVTTCHMTLNFAIWGNILTTK